MKKNNRKGFVLAETLIVTVFLMVIFGMIYTNFYPLIGEYEKREVYDDVDGKYSVYWIKRMIEDESYQLTDNKKVNNLINKGFVRFECEDIQEDEKKTMCKNLVVALEVEGCDADGSYCEIYITKYRLGDKDSEAENWFKNATKKQTKRYKENCSDGDDICRNNYVIKCKSSTRYNKYPEEEKTALCTEKANQKIFRTGFSDYVEYLPYYTAKSLNYANYRVIVSFHHKKDNNNYYSYATMEVDK